MLIGREDGPRFEASREGVRLIGYARWPGNAPAAASDGRPLKRSYAARVDSIMEQQRARERCTELGWDQLLGLEAAFVGRFDGDTAQLGPITHRFFGAEWTSNPDVGLGGLVLPAGWGGVPLRGSDVWNDPGLFGTAAIQATTHQGAYVVVTPVDRQRFFPFAHVHEFNDLMTGWIASPATREALPAAWPTGRFKPGRW